MTQEQHVAVKSNDRKGGIFIDGEFIILLGGGFGYDIHLQQIRDYESLNEWVNHLACKRWMDDENMQRFVDLVCAAKRWNPQDFAEQCQLDVQL